MHDIVQAEPIVLAENLRFPEGPAIAPDGSIWCVELQAGSLVRIEGMDIRKQAVGGAPNGLAWLGNELWFCDADRNSVRRLMPDETVETVVGASDRLPVDRPNDLAFDRAGNLVFTCPGNSRQAPTGKIWCRCADGKIALIFEGLYFPNGLAFSADGTELVVAETYRQRLWRGDWDGDLGRWSNARIWATTTGPIGPDGMAFDIDGNLWVAIFDQGHVVAIGQDGSEIRRLVTKGRRPTNVAFHRAGGLLVTEAELGQLLHYPSLPSGAPVFSHQICPI